MLSDLFKRVFQIDHADQPDKQACYYFSCIYFSNPPFFQGHGKGYQYERYIDDNDPLLVPINLQGQERNNTTRKDHQACKKKQPVTTIIIPEQEAGHPVEQEGQQYVPMEFRVAYKTENVEEPKRQILLTVVPKTLQHPGKSCCALWRCKIIILRKFRE